jgi:subtilisin family serine protease
MPNMAKIFRIPIQEGISRGSVMDSLKRLPEVLFAEPNMDAKLFADPTYSNQWHLNNTGQSGGTPGADIKAEQAWSIFTGSSSVILGVIDSGVETNHEDLSGKASGDSPDGSYHGTHVAGIAAAKANNDLGGRGVDWNAQILSKRIFDHNGYVGDATAANQIISAANSAHILNNSWGGTSYSTTLRMAFAYAYKMNRTAIVAMGNDYEYGNPITYPAAFGQGIIAVGATTDQDARSGYSQTGNHIDVVAPGGINPYPNNNLHDIWSTWGGGTYRWLAGTSMAAPIVSGIASLLKGYNTNLDNDDIEHIIRISADDKGVTGWDIEYGTGRVNARKALDFLRSPYALDHKSASGGSVYSSSGIIVEGFYGVPNLSDGYYYAIRYDVRKTVNLSSNNLNPIV